MPRFSLSAGELDQRITFQSLVAGEDDLGQPNGEWTPVSPNPTVWAKSAFLSGRDYEAAAQQQASLDAKFYLRYRADLLAAWRVLWKGAVFEIIGEPVNIDGGNEWLEIRCTKAST